MTTYTYHDDLATDNLIKGLFTSIHAAEDVLFDDDLSLTIEQERRITGKIARMTDKLEALINS